MELFIRPRMIDMRQFKVLNWGMNSEMKFPSLDFVLCRAALCGADVNYAGN